MIWGGSGEEEEKERKRKGGRDSWVDGTTSDCHRMFFKMRAVWNSKQNHGQSRFKREDVHTLTHTFSFVFDRYTKNK